jgi:hypothetical protein
MQREEKKLVKIGEYEYEIQLMTPQNACWVAMSLMTKLLPMGLDQKIDTGNIPGRATMTESEFHNIQDHCLRVCGRTGVIGDQRVVEPLVRADGRLNFEDLSKDFVSVMTLTLNALVFNVSPFFAEGALEQMTSSLANFKALS